MSKGMFRLSRVASGVALAFSVGQAPFVLAGDACSLQIPTSSVVCVGDQSDGVAVGHTLLVGGSVLQSPPVTRIDVLGLTDAIAPAAELSGIYLHNEAGNAVEVSAGTTNVPVAIDVTGNDAGGIVVNGYGTPTPTADLFGLVLPSGTGGSGGNVTVESFATITTDGNDAPGIHARSRAGGYPAAVVSTLQSLQGINLGNTFQLDTVQGDAANIGKSVTGSNGGSFTLSSAGGYTYDLAGMGLDTLEAGQHIDTTVAYTITSSLGYAPSDAWLTLRITRLADGSLTVQPSTYFSVYGRRASDVAVLAYTVGSGAHVGEVTLQPDFDAYMDRLLADSAVGGAGGNVVVTASGSITTKSDASLGQGSYGILAQSKGGTGLAGGGGVFSGDTGNAGSAGGAVTVTNSATIHTYGEGAHGIVASSSGGDGGRGGGASFAGNGGAGGAGAKGGAVTVVSTGDITTESDAAFGILAQSIGGRGGEGGGGGWLGGGGGSGGGGAENDAVFVSSSGAITTYGDDAHGILAQNIGGFGGGGGGASGIVALGSDGGNAGTGGLVTIENFGKVTTSGFDANALMAQSIGGGGGSAGGTGGLVALGGDGTAGGNGGTATLTNSGELTASGLGARGILVQSIGGGGGNGGDSGGLVAIGGDGATTSDGGSVSVTNSGKITSASNAIFAESVGGGGGVGGSSGGWFGVGGDGGGGGDGGTVSVTNSADLSTSGRNAAALFAQSVGGGGGSGGNVVSVGAFASVAVGGSGGTGGDGRAVAVNSTAGSIETQGFQSHGIYAQSVGGRGGNGGFAVAVSAGKGFSASLAVGGGAGGGGDGAEVDVDSQSDITTHEEEAHGIYAQSVGGGGGTGGFAVSAAGAVQGIAASFAVGGSGGDGGQGGAVTVGKNTAVGGTIETHGTFADGIFAQSVGGGGGHGGLSVAAEISAGGSGGGLSFSLGGSGGEGGNAKAVTVNSAADITTNGEKAYGIRAQSVGGGGGDGGIAIAGSIGGGANSLKLDVAIGGSGAKGGTGSTVDVDTTGGSIETFGKDAHGIFAQSVGGGGGDGGMAISGTVGLGGNNVNVSISAGGTGGSGSIGDKVTVGNAAAITTHGDAAFGIFAQSVGGGGGKGGAAFSGAADVFTNQQGYKVNLDFAFGGSGGSGNAGGAVAVTNTAKGDIETYGVAAHGIFAESVGGGGGQGGSARTMSINLGGVGIDTSKYLDFGVNLGGSGGSGGDGSIVTVTNAGSIITHNADAHGIYAQSVGAGGGSGGEGAHGFFGVPTVLVGRTPPYQQLSVSMGGNAGAAGDGKTVTVNQQGSITTDADGSWGIFAQSVGGGGGTGGVGAMGLTGTVGIGGKGGASGDGGAVAVTVNGDIDTYGGTGYGVFAQSVGGGGGVGGNVDRGLTWLGIDHGIGIGAGITLNSGNGGNGAAVSVTGHGDIHTRGDSSAGIFAQSVGGGGGVAGDQFGYGHFGSAGGNGSGDLVWVAWTGSIVTDGNTADGIVAQSAGGKATNVVVYDEDGNPTTTTLTSRQNLAKDVSVTVAGDVIANGVGSNAIFAQSEGDTGNGNISVNIQAGGTIKGGSGADAAGIRLVGGVANSIDNTGSIATADGIRGQAIVGGTGDDSVSNHGTVTGSVRLGGGSNAFANSPGSVFNAGTIVDLGAANTLVNRGALAPGGAGAAATTTLTGQLSQPDGTLAVDLDRATRSVDRIDVSGSAQLGGKVALAEMSRGYARPGQERYTLLHADDGARDDGIALVAPRSAASAYSLAFGGGDDLVLSITTDFAPRGLTANQSAIGRTINRIQAAGGSAAMAPIVAALFDLPDTQSLEAAYAHLSPEPYLSAGSSTQFSSLGFSDAMHSCGVRDGADRFIREGECNWLAVTSSEVDQDASSSGMGFKQRSSGLSGGLQRAVGDGSWHAGLGFAYEHSVRDVDDFARTSGDQGQIGAILKKGFGATSLAVDLSAGYGSYHSDRYVVLPSPIGIARSTQEVKFVAGHLRLAHVFERAGNWYVKPAVDLGLSQAWFPAFAESGAGGASLDVAAHREAYVDVAPSIEIGGEKTLADGTLLRPYARLGITHFVSGSSSAVVASFQGAPSGVAPFTIAGEMDKTYLDINLGMNVLFAKGTVLRVAYVGKVSEHVTANGLMLKLAVPF